MEFFSSIHGAIADDYFYVISKNGGKKTYYSKLTNGIIKMNDINQTIILDIKEDSKYFETKEIMKLITKKKRLEDQLKYIERDLSQTVSKLASNNITSKLDENKFEINYNTTKQKYTERKAKLETERKERIKTNFNNGFRTAPSQFNILDTLNIKSKMDWKEWLRRNHTDKGGDEELCKSIITAGREKGW